MTPSIPVMLTSKIIVASKVWLTFIPSVMLSLVTGTVYEGCSKVTKATVVKVNSELLSLHENGKVDSVWAIGVHCDKY